MECPRHRQDRLGLCGRYDDIDHINVFGVWHKGKAEIRNDVAKLHAAGMGGHKDFTIEKIRMMKPDIAVVQVKAISKFCNLGTYVMSKQSGKWLVVSFTSRPELSRALPNGAVLHSRSSGSV